MDPNLAIMATNILTQMTGLSPPQPQPKTLGSLLGNANTALQMGSTLGNMIQPQAGQLNITPGVYRPQTFGELMGQSQGRGPVY